MRTARVKLATFVLTGFLTGMCGAIYAYYLGSIYPPFAFEAIFDVTIALMAFLGGLGSVSGPVIGALILEPLQQYFTLQFTGGGPISDHVRRAVPGGDPVPARRDRAFARPRCCASGCVRAAASPTGCPRRQSGVTAAVEP